MKWVTRAGMHVDRTACAWLIRRWIDPDAEFLFVTAADRLPADATAFDIAGHPFSHHDGECTFEVLLRHHELGDPDLVRATAPIYDALLEAIRGERS